MTAVLGVASVAAALALDPVYSVNAVGYVNLEIPSGFSILANPLKATDNKLSALFPKNLPADTTVFLFRNNRFDMATFALDDNGVLNWDTDFEILPGEGAFIRNPSATKLTVTFVGEVMQSTTGPLATPIPAGFSLRASQVPQAGILTTDLAFPATESDAIFFYRNGRYDMCLYSLDDNGALNWDTVPSPNVGEGFWVNTKTARTWNRTFSVNPLPN